jgi:dihydrofolate reductase
MASEVVAYVAVSLDGFIAGDGGSVDFLTDFHSHEYDFDGFFSTVGALVMGSTTYEQVVGFGWPYGNTPALVLTTRDLEPIDGVDITVTSGKTGEVIRAYATSHDGRVWVVGGGEVITDGLAEGAIDTLELYLMPVVLGTGVPLFTESIEGRLTLIESQTFTNGVVRLVYKPT